MKIFIDIREWVDCAYNRVRATRILKSVTKDQVHDIEVTRLNYNENTETVEMDVKVIPKCCPTYIKLNTTIYKDGQVDCSVHGGKE